MFWADRIVSEILAKKRGEPIVIRDEKTLSGRVHIGSMRGVAIHGLVSDILTERGIAHEFQYELNDFDHFDSIPSYLPEEVYREHLGKPLFSVPAPEGSTHANFAEHFATEFVGVHQKAGWTPTYYRARELYLSGAMDRYVRTALEKAEEIRKIFKEVSGSSKPEGWLPISVLCEHCGKIATTTVTDFDGETVQYVCERSPDGSVPCGHSARVAPWKGTAKLTWKVDWAAKWGARSVTIEGAGKDHSTKGGSRDVANHLAREVFGYESPFDIPYEFFLVGGKKMSSSKGRGSSSKDIADLFPPEVFRLALIGKDINQAINFDPEGETVPEMYDWYDTLAESYFGEHADDFARLFFLSHAPHQRAGLGTMFRPRFSQVAFLVQMPHLNYLHEIETQKGAVLTDEERHFAEIRAAYATFWLTTYAPEKYRYVLQQQLPENITLHEKQKQALAALHAWLSVHPEAGAEEIHGELHGYKERFTLAPKELFSALYTIFLARESGPKAGWFLAGLPREFVLARLEEASR
jgi:lysyl-tRNA synthetase class 1